MPLQRYERKSCYPELTQFLERIRHRMEITRASVAHVPDIAKLALLLWETHTFEDLFAEFSELTENPQAAVFLAVHNGEAVGFSQCGLRNDYVEGTSTNPVGYLEGVFIKESFRKKGFAKALVKSCEEWAKKQGCTEFASDCELTNAESLHFHLSVGFEEANRIICFKKSLYD